MITFFAIGNPKATPRPKAARIGGFTRIYTPGTADDWKMIVRHECGRVWDHRQIEGPIALTLEFFFDRPANHTGKKGLKPWAPSFHTSKPDVDNLAKAIMDALTNLGVWKDDSQVADLIVRKLYRNQNGAQGCRVTIKPETE